MSNEGKNPERGSFSRNLKTKKFRSCVRVGHPFVQLNQNRSRGFVGFVLCSILLGLGSRSRSKKSNLPWNLIGSASAVSRAGDTASHHSPPFFGARCDGWVRVGPARLGVGAVSCADHDKLASRGSEADPPTSSRSSPCLIQSFCLSYFFKRQ